MIWWSLGRVHFPHDKMIIVLLSYWHGHEGAPFRLLMIITAMYTNSNWVQLLCCWIFNRKYFGNRFRNRLHLTNASAHRLFLWTTKLSSALSNRITKIYAFHYKCCCIKTTDELINNEVSFDNSELPEDRSHCVQNIPPISHHSVVQPLEASRATSRSPLCIH